jgi:hypothetical protein
MSPRTRISNSNTPAAKQYSRRAVTRDGQPLPVVAKRSCSGRYRTAIKPAACITQKNGKVKPSSM